MGQQAVNILNGEYQKKSSFREEYDRLSNSYVKRTDMLRALRGRQTRASRISSVNGAFAGTTAKKPITTKSGIRPGRLRPGRIRGK